MKKFLLPICAGLILLGVAGWFVLPHLSIKGQDRPEEIYQKLEDLASDQQMGSLFNYLKQAQGMRLDLNHRNAAGQRAIDIAAAQDQGQAAAAFIVAGSNINDMDANGDTVIHIAVRNHALHVIKALRHFMPQLELRNKKGQTPLELANQMGDVDTAAELTASLSAN